MQDSWLLDAIDELHICVIWWTIKTNNPKIIVHDYWNNFKQYEFPTLELLQEKCKNDPNMKVFYLHTKWASKPFNTGDIEWRRDMTKCVVKRYKECINLLDEYDTVWTRMLLLKTFPRHYSWNFRWANATYINTLHSFEWRKSDRYVAETRVCSNKEVLYYNM